MLTTGFTTPLIKLSGIHIGPTTGKITFYEIGDKMFPAYCDCIGWGLNIPDKAKPECLIDTDELQTYGRFIDIFGDDLAKLEQISLTQEQIINVIKARPDIILKEHHVGTSFLVKKSEGYYVVSIFSFNAGLGAFVAKLYNSNDPGVRCPHRFVSQRTPKF